MSARRATDGKSGRKRPGRNTTWPLGRNFALQQPAAVLFWLSEVAALPSFAHKPRVPKRCDYDRDHDHFQKFQSISPPFAAGCSGLFRQGDPGRKCFSQLFFNVSQPGTSFIGITGCAAPVVTVPHVEDSCKSSKQWPERPRS